MHHIFAEIMNVEIVIFLGMIQANARGAAFIAAVGLNEINFEDIPQLVQISSRYSPTESTRQLYNERYSIFLEIYKQMHGIYRKLNNSPHH